MTLKEIARQCNTSPATVSRVLNNYTKNFSVTPKLREAILNCAKQSDYKPNTLFQTLRTNANNPISFLFNSPDARFSYGTTMSIIETTIASLQTEGYQCNFSFAPDPNRSFYQKPFWKSQAMVLPDVLSDNQLISLEDPGCPLLILNGYSSRNLDIVNNDEYANTRLLMNCLYEHGHRKILYVDTPFTREHYSVPDREKSFRKLCGEFGISAPMVIYSEETIRQAMSLHVTALLVYSRNLAKKLLYQAWRQGIHIPTQLSIVSFDDSDSAEYSIPPLTCLRPGYVQMGEFAAKLLVDRITGEQNYGAPRIFKFSGQLVLRESVAKCKKM